MSKFKENDKVVCIDAGGFSDGWLKAGEVYTVHNYDLDCGAVQLKEDVDYFQFCASRFELVQPKSTELKQQVIHCNNQECRHQGIKGSTWVLTKVEDSRYVGVQFAVCSHKDNYYKKVGVQVAKQMEMHEVLKTELPNFIRGTGGAFKCLIPSHSQIYQAVVRLD